MSKNAKNARNLDRARRVSQLHKEGRKGPSKTEVKHTKKKDNRVYSTKNRGNIYK